MKLRFQDYISIKIHKTDLQLTNYIKEKLAPYNLAPEQNLIMMLLWEKDGLTQNQLVEALTKDKTNIARMAASLENKGFVKRINCDKDRRSIRLYLTETGKELGKDIIPIAEQFDTVVCNGITKDELEQLEKLLKKMNANVERLL